jgi:hypothetical protein
MMMKKCIKPNFGSSTFCYIEGYFCVFEPFIETLFKNQVNLCSFRHGSGGYFSSGMVTSSGIGSGTVHCKQQYATLGIELENHRTRMEAGPTPIVASTLPSYWMRHDYGPYIEVDSGTRLTSAPTSRYPVTQAPSQAQSRWHQERNRCNYRFYALPTVMCKLL